MQYIARSQYIASGILNGRRGRTGFRWTNTRRPNCGLVSVKRDERVVVGRSGLKSLPRGKCAKSSDSSIRWSIVNGVFTHKWDYWRRGVGVSEGNETSSFVPRLPARSLLSRLRPGEGAPSLFSPVLRSGEPGAPPAANAELARSSSQSLQKSRRCPSCGADGHTLCIQKKCRTWSVLQRGSRRFTSQASGCAGGRRLIDCCPTSEKML